MCMRTGIEVWGTCAVTVVAQHGIKWYLVICCFYTELIQPLMRLVRKSDGFRVEVNDILRA